NVGRLRDQVTIELPLEIRVQGSADVSRPPVVRRQRDESRHGVYRVTLGVAPEDVDATVGRYALRKVQSQVRVDVDDVLRPNQAGIVEVARLEEERIDGFEPMVALLSITARYVELCSEPRRPGQLPGVPRVDARRPRQDRVASKAAELQNLLGVPIPVLQRPE